MNQSPDKRDEAANEKRDEAGRFEVWMDATREWWRSWSYFDGAACSQAQIGDMMREAFEAGFNTASAPSSIAPKTEEPWAYAVMQPKGAEFDYLIFPDYGEAESHVTDYPEEDCEIIPLFPRAPVSAIGARGELPEAFVFMPPGVLARLEECRRFPGTNIMERQDLAFLHLLLDELTRTRGTMAPTDDGAEKT